MQGILTPPAPSAYPATRPNLRLVKGETAPTYDAAPKGRTLTGESPLIVLPTLACKVGLGEAVFLQQLHYLASQGFGAEREGRRWIFQSYEQWHERFPFWSVAAIGRMVRKLAADGFIEVTTRFNTSVIDQRRWYRLRYEHPCLAGLIAAGAESTDSQNGRTDSQIGDTDSYIGDTNSKIVIGIKTTDQDYKNEKGDTPPSPPDPVSPPPAYSSAFETFWAAYPSGHGSKRATYARWRQAGLGAGDLPAILAGLTRWKASDRWRRGYVKDAQVWVKDRWWEDEAPAAEARASPNGKPRNAVEAVKAAGDDAAPDWLTIGTEP